MRGCDIRMYDTIHKDGNLLSTKSNPRIIKPEKGLLNCKQAAGDWNAWSKYCYLKDSSVKLVKLLLTAWYSTASRNLKTKNYANIFMKLLRVIEQLQTLKNKNHSVEKL